MHQSSHVLRTAIHKLLEKSHWASFSSNCKHSWLEISGLCVQPSLPGFGLTFCVLYELDAIVVFAELKVIHFHFSVFLPVTESKILSK